MSRLMLNWPKSYDRLAAEIVRQEMVVVASVNHTGTWFLLRFLSRCPSVEESEILEVHDALARNALNHRSILQFHVGGAPDMWDFFDTFRKRSGVRVLVPMRDPMQAIITRQARHPFLDHTYQVDAFVRIAENHEGVTFVPVDCEEENRLHVLHHAANATGWGFPDTHVQSWASSWPVHNTIGYDTAEKSAYRNNDKKNVCATLGHEVRELLDSRDILIPFLKQLGYKELSWWSW